MAKLGKELNVGRLHLVGSSILLLTARATFDIADVGRFRLRSAVERDSG